MIVPKGEDLDRLRQSTNKRVHRRRKGRTVLHEADRLGNAAGS
jgi:hypothetical protein